MKKIALALLVASLNLPLAFADHDNSRTVPVAENLVRALQQLGQAALQAGDREATRSSTGNEHGLNNIAEQAYKLVVKTHTEILRPLMAGESPRQVERELSHLSYEIEDLERGVRQSRYRSVALAYNQVDHSMHDLERALDGRGGDLPDDRTPQVSASCAGNYGGNFFDKKTSVECRIFGKGIAGYKVELFNTDLGARVERSGRLDPNSSQQTFKTQNASVGRGASYVVYAITQRGRTIQVASGVATGNPF